MSRRPTHGKGTVSRGVVVWTGGRIPNGQVPSPGNLRAISMTGQCCLHPKGLLKENQ